MSTVFRVVNEAGSSLDARFSLDEKDVIVHSRGGTKGRGGVNVDYAEGLLLIVRRLSQATVRIVGAWVDSAVTQALAPEQRSIFDAQDHGESPERLCSLMASRMKSVRVDPSETKGGNSTKRIRIATDFEGSKENFAALLGGVPVNEQSRSAYRLPVATLNLATPEYVWIAVQRLLQGNVHHSFGESTDFDLIADDGRRLPPKAVLGVALSLALGGDKIGPQHFSAGERSVCFRLLREAGYQVIPKGAPSPERASELNFDQEWAEGEVRIRTHLKRERAKGLAKAKKAQYRRVHGKLTCERCGLDPVAEYGTVQAEACIEVHHSSTQISQMATGHKTSLDDLQCLCANCHRLVHKMLC